MKVESESEKGMFLQSCPGNEKDVEPYEGLKEEEEETSVCGRPFVVVKLEDEPDGQGTSNARSASEAEMEISLFAPVESSEEEDHQLRCGFDSDPSRDRRHRHGNERGQEEHGERPRRRTRGRRKRPRPPQAGTRSVGPSAVTRMEMMMDVDGGADPRQNTPPEKRARSTLWDPPPPKTFGSGVWKYFEYLTNPNGQVEDDGFPVCKLCQQRVTCKRGNTSNMLRHLQDHHAAAYRQAKKVDAVWSESDSSTSAEEFSVDEDDGDLGEEWQSEADHSDDDDDDDGDDDSQYGESRCHKSPRQRRQVRSAVWQYFDYNEGVSEADRRPACKMCAWQPSPGSTCSTSNMRHHLQARHQIVCPLVQAAIFAGPVVPLAEGDDPVKLYPPKTRRKSAVWKLFGFVMNAEGVVEENGFPICRLCQQVVASKDGNTSNMYSHLQRHHQAVYTQIKEAVNPSRTEQLQELPDSMVLHPPSKHCKSPAWKHFGYLRNAEGVLKEDGFPLCRMCLRKVAAKDGTTSNMLNHLRRHHLAEFEEVKLATDTLPTGSMPDGSGLPELFPPTRLPLSPVWDYFGYPKNADGVVEENEHPRCKACRRAIISKQGILANMLRHLKFHHNSLFAELKLRTGSPRQYKERRRPSPVRTTPDELYPPKAALRSAVWKHFGYLKNPRGAIVPDGFPVCKLCLRKVSAQGGSTTNMMVHLQRYHVAEFAEMKLCGEDTDDQVPKQTYQPSDLHPPRDLLEPVWEHFGYPKDADGVVQVEGRPICKLCGIKISCVGDDTKFLYRHLWKKHNSVYHEVKVATNSLREEEGTRVPVLYPPTQKVKSAVWEYFGYLKDTEGNVVCDGFPICKLCQLNVAAKGGNTTNMFKHLKDHHKGVYDEIRPSEMVPGVCSPSELYTPDGQNSKLWEYFGYPKNGDGVLIEDGAPVCKICVHKVMSRGGTISNMMKHLLDSHDAVYAEVQAALAPSGPVGSVDPPGGLDSSELHPPTEDATSPVWQYFGFPKNTDGLVVVDSFPFCKMCREKVEAKDGDTTCMFSHLKVHHLHVYREIKLAGGKRLYKPFELLPPNGQISLRLWDHFGYPKNADGVVEDDGEPVCKICLQKLTTSSKGVRVSTSMLRHLRKKHQDVYEEVQEAISALQPENGTDTPELHPPTPNVTSPVWEFFGYLKDGQGSVVCDGFPICRMCRQKVASKGGTTSNMFKHLKDYHRAVYDEIRSAVTNERFEDVCTSADIHPPSQQHDPTLWEHFGYRKSADGVLEEDGAPFCKLCLRKLVSKGEMARNMRQHLKENHNIVHPEPEEVVSSSILEGDNETSNLHPPTRKVKSAVWKFFGYPRDTEGSIKCDGFPICKLCQKKVSAKGGNTTNMFTHLRDYHRTTYDEIKAAIPARPESDLEPLELHLPTSDAVSPVWKYFGYLKDSDGAVVCDGFPICKMCQQKVVVKAGNTTNMLIHLRAYHLDIYKEVKPAVTKKVLYRPLELYPPSGQSEIKLWDHFGYPRNADGELQDDGAPICKICLRKLIKASSDGTPTTNMLRHLRKKHQSVYEEVQEAITALRTEWGIEPPELHPPTQNVTSPVWQFFGYLKDAQGSVVCDGFPICKVCQQKVASKSRCTTNMFKHLKDYHRAIYDEIRSAVTNETFEDVCLPVDLHPPSGQYNPKLWEHFGYRKTAEGILEEDGAPICKLCFRKLISKGETTANIMQHLKENHSAEHTDVQSAVNPFTIGGATELPELHPPEHRVRSAVWKHFGYVKDAQAPSDCAGFPFCKICLAKVSNKGKVTANMTAHLKDNHRSIYNELKIPEKKQKVVSVENLPELYPPSKQPKSPIWEHFGIPKNADGVVEDDGCPICKVCAKKISSQDVRKMMRHLQFCHIQVYEEFRKSLRTAKLGLEGSSPSDLHPPSKNVRSSVWEYFGYLKNPDGKINVDGRPICKTCFQKVSSQGGNTTNMFKHLEDKHGYSERDTGPPGSGSSNPYAAAAPARTSSPPAGFEPPVFPTSPLLDGARATERPEKVLLEVLTHCRLLQAAVQRLEKKLDVLQPCPCADGPHENPPQGVCTLLEGVEHLGPSPQTSPQRGWSLHHQAPPPPASPSLGGSRPPGGGRGRGRRRRGGGAKRGVPPGLEQGVPGDETEQVGRANGRKRLPPVGGAKMQSNQYGPGTEDMPPDENAGVKERIKVMIGGARGRVWIPRPVFTRACEEAEPQQALTTVLSALYPTGSTSCSVVLGDQHRAVLKLGRNKQEALRGWLEKMFPQYDMSLRGVVWAQCLDIIKGVTDLHSGELRRSKQSS